MENALMKERLRSLAEGVRLVGKAMKQKNSAINEMDISSHVAESLARQEKALQQETAAIMERVRTLRSDH
ncbi:unnamed protein product [Phytophthora fragariaefolia]|uniref:Unnamed protein product n=1 Tax=Phytophthora fragariaefolia TaxID=1490495 RepID=A0A9W7CVW4_9STRA|nr:unnamed protein product [Phytophthora fragariaefolia]